MLKTLNAMQRGDQRGFTLVELLIVVAIIAILAAIALPQFAQYRKRGYVATINSDAKNAFNACAAFYAGTPAATTCSCAQAALNGFQPSPTAACAGGLDTAAVLGTLITINPAGAAVGQANAATINGNGLLVPSTPTP